MAKKKDPFALAKKINKEAGIKETPALKKMRKESLSKEKAHDKEYKKYLKERKARYKREGISG